MSKRLRAQAASHGVKKVGGCACHGIPVKRPETERR